VLCLKCVWHHERVLDFYLILSMMLRMEEVVVEEGVEEVEEVLEVV
jgi:hypothetical protein